MKHSLKLLRQKKTFLIFCSCILTVVVLYALLPKPDLYNRYSFSSAVYDRQGRLLKLSLSLDDKYRLFVPLKDIPAEARQALLLYEDKHFYRHFGINPFSLFRALASMAGGGRRQGASTLTMQVARIIYQIDSTTVRGKIMQILRALQIELFYSKSQILEAYFNIAPYGGNIEGIGAAALIYFKTDVSHLNLPQITALTVIPQNPVKRSLLTDNGRMQNDIARSRLKNIWLHTYPHSQNDYLQLPLETTVFLPDYAPHFTRRILKNQTGSIRTTLNLEIQQQLEATLRRYVTEQRQKGVFNAAALLLDSRDMSVAAYIGSADFYNPEIFGQVDGITAKRSPGSALKPFIYAMALEKGLIHPLSMLKDVPRRYGFYAPENFDHSYYGLIDATRALILSRNIPAVDLLLQIGETNFYNLLKSCGVNPARPADYYGLAMALGGVEVSMENLAVMYAMLANGGKFSPLRLTEQTPMIQQPLLSPEAAFLTRQMLTRKKISDISRPSFILQSTYHDTAWKTGTSYSYRDAWTAGIFGPYVLIVWLGNFDGTPNQAFIGQELAEPLFFRLSEQVPRTNKDAKQPEIPAELNLTKVKICKDTGDLANPFCTKQTETYFISGITAVKTSNVARLIPVDTTSGLRACRHTPPTTVLKSYNFWPSDVIKAFQDAGINFKQPPAFKENCDAVEEFKQGFPPKISEPADGTKLLVRSGTSAKIALNATADADVKTIYWFINDHFVGKTKTGEVLETSPVYGAVQIKAVDDFGQFSTISLTIQPVD